MATKSKKEKFIITEEMIRKADSYIKHAKKKAIAKATAQVCLEAADRQTAEIAAEVSLPIPQIYSEVCGTKSLYLMYYFLTEYLHLNLGDEFTEEQYDYYAASHIFNQLERFKSGDVEIKNKVFDLLYDFKQLKSMLETEIYNLKEAKNNVLDRMQSYLDLFASPENISKLNNLLQKTADDLGVAQKKLAEKREIAQAAEKTNQTGA